MFLSRTGPEGAMSWINGMNMPAYLVLPGTSLLPTGLLQFLTVSSVLLEPLERNAVQLSVGSDHFSVRERPWRWLGHEGAEPHVGNMRGEGVQAVENVRCIYPACQSLSNGRR